MKVSTNVIRTFKLRSLTVLGLSLLFSGCWTDMNHKKGGDAATNSQNGAFVTNMEKIPTSVKHKPDAVALAEQTMGLNLANTPIAVTTYSITLANCASGHTATANSSTPDLTAIKFDKGCLAKLQSFTYNSVAYTPKTNLGFSKYTVGEIATFSGTDANSNEVLLFVQVVNQLSYSVQTADTVGYQFYENSSSTSAVVSHIGSTSTVTSQGYAGIKVTAAASLLTDITANGEGKLKFTLECDDDLANTSPLTGATCNSVLLSSLDYVLITDSDTNAVWDLATVRVMFGLGGTPTDVNSATDILDLTDLDLEGNALTHGGFNTATLTSANPHTFPDARLIIREKDGSGNGVSFADIKIHIAL